MRRKHDDDNESIWDAFMKPASMDYNGDGKIDDYDLYIEMDEIDKALGRGKYDPYEDPYYIAQQEREDAKIYGKGSAYYDEDLDGGSDFDEEAFMNEVPRVTPLVDDESDDDEDDAYDDEDEAMDDLYDSYEPHDERTTERTITLSFSFESQLEKERKKFPTTGIWQYFDNDMEWKFTQALYTYDKSLKESCGTKYDGSDEVEYLLRDIYQFDRKRAIDDWVWLLKTFPAEVLNSAKVSYGLAHSFRLSMRVFNLMFSYDDYSELALFISRDEVFEYLTTQAQWPEHDTIYLYELLVCCHKCGDELFKKCYKTVIDKQKHCFCDKDLAEVWNSVVIRLEWKNVSESLKTYIKEEVVKVGDFGKPVLKTIEEKEEELEEERRQEEEERRWKEEKKREAEERAARVEECRLQQERLEAERKEREQQMKILEEMSAPLSTKIIGGELFDEAYMAVNQQFEYCFGSSRKTYDTVARYVLGKNGKIRDINKDLQVGVISSKDIKNIFMLTSTGGDITSYNYAKYSGRMPDLESDRKRLEINKPIVEYICKCCYAAKLMQLYEYGSSKDIYYYQSNELKRAYNCWRDCEIKARDEAKAIFGDITNKGVVKVSWIDEKRLFTYAQLNYPDAEYKYSPYWSDGLCFDIYIPSLNLIIEYKQYFDDSTAPIEKERQAEEEQKFNKKRRLCEEHGITFAAWDSRTPINEANFLQLIINVKR